MKLDLLHGTSRQSHQSGNRLARRFRIPLKHVEKACLDAQGCETGKQVVKLEGEAQQYLIDKYGADRHFVYERT